MATTLVVDGYNAINAIPETKKKLKTGLPAARRAIMAISREYARSSGYITDIRVVFDGDDRYRYLDALELPRGRSQVFSATGKGDAKIIDTVRRRSRYGKVVVASNDNYVRNNSRAYNASLISVDELAGGKKPAARKAEKAIGKKIDRKVREDITREYRRKLGL